MNVNEIQTELFRNQDMDYRDFQAKLLPTLAPDTIIGVRTPTLRAFAKKLYKENGMTFIEEYTDSEGEQTVVYGIIRKEWAGEVR